MGNKPESLMWKLEEEEEEEEEEEGKKHFSEKYK
jgi:hypothetical protein